MTPNTGNAMSEDKQVTGVRVTIHRNGKLLLDRHVDRGFSFAYNDGGDWYASIMDGKGTHEATYTATAPVVVLPPAPWRLGEHYGIGRHFQDILDATGQVMARVRVDDLVGGERVPWEPGLALVQRILAMGKVAD